MGFVVRSWSGRITYGATGVESSSLSGVDDVAAPRDWEEGPEEASDESVVHGVDEACSWESSSDAVVDAQSRHRVLLERIAAEKAAEVVEREAHEARMARRRMRKRQLLAERSAARRAAKEVAAAPASPQPAEESDEASVEAARVAHVRATRRRQKEQYKRLLDELARKRRRDAEARSAKADADQAFRQKLKASASERRRRVLSTEARGSGAAAARARQTTEASSSGAEETSASAAKRRESCRLATERQRRHLGELVAARREREREAAEEASRRTRRRMLRARRVLAAAEAKRDPATRASSSEEEAEEDKVRMSATAQRALVERLNAARQQAGWQPAAARDFADWKRKRGISQEQRVFVLTGWYPCVKEALEQRGWVHNPDRDSPFFDLKWTLTSQHLRGSELEPWQRANHFQKTRSLVTKVGLSQTLTTMPWHVRETPDAVFPRCYDLSSPAEVEAFAADFRRLEALRVLQALVRLGTAAVVNAEVLAAAIAVGERLLRALRCEDLDEPDAPPEAAAQVELLALVAPKILDDDLEVTATALGAAAQMPPTPPSRRCDCRRDDTTEEDGRRRRASRRQRELRARARLAERAARPGVSPDASTVDRARRVLEEVAALARQPGLDGLRATIRNLWIVKPAAKSRGRGIATFSDLDALMEYCDLAPPRGVEAATWKPAGGLWIVQKYVENQLLIAGRKFDLRQWVLVTSWNPLQVWFYDECYSRFSAATFTPDRTELRNDYVHLVNNSISKTSAAFHDAVVAENGVEIVDCMWTLDQFKTYIRWRHAQDPSWPRQPLHLDDTPRALPGRIGDDVDVFSSTIQPAMRRIATCALVCAQETVEHRSNSWELYGFDFMLDDAGQPWLIEINSSPACDYSTAVTEAFVQRALVDILKVTLDHAEWQPASDQPEPDTGGWRRIYLGPALETPVASFGRADIVCRGQSIREPRELRRARLARDVQHHNKLAACRSLDRDQAPVPAPPEVDAPLSAPEGPAEPFVAAPRPPREQPRRSVAAKVPTPPSRKPAAIPVKITTVTMDI